MSLDQLIDTVAVSFRENPTPGEADIELRLVAIGTALGADKAVIDAARRELHARFQVRMDKGLTLESGEHHPWLAGRRANIDWYYWPRFRTHLTVEGWPGPVVATLDQATDDIFDLMGDPMQDGKWRRRGLVMGDVQSGKTATYTALICKAADAGYRLVILLTGMLENVRRQTQKRLDEGFVGLDSGDWLVRGRAQRTALVGVGTINQGRQAIVFTSRKDDFKAALVNALNLSLAAVNEPVLVVCKKNARILNNLTAWLRAKNPTADGKIEHPLLLIDDEADNASINTKQNSGDVTAINQGIRGLLDLFRRSSYCGFTATPFANIFIEPDTVDGMLGDDLFPANFIHVLEPPTNYMGMSRLFAGTDGESPDPEADSEAARTLRLIEDADTWLPVDHKKDDQVDDLSDSLLEAFRTFLVGCAIRDLRVADGDTGRGGGIHRSMLVNVSRFTAVQDEVADLLRVTLDRIRTEVRLYGALEPRRAAAASTEIAFLEETWKREFSFTEKQWSRVLHALYQAIGPVEIRSVNQRTGAASLDYSAISEPPGLRVVAVGGQSLSRGLTLEGLQVSYFLRNSRAYDTLMQMARWFGYRDGYRDLCRVWLTEEAEAWYRHVTLATQELRRDFLRMWRMSATPRDFGLRVRRHPDSLLITARNKMTSGRDITMVEREVSLDGRFVETTRLWAAERRIRGNLERVTAFLTSLARPPMDSPHRGAFLWPAVDGRRVADLLRNFEVHYQNHDYQGDSLARLVEAAVEDGDSRFAEWTVALMTSGEGKSLALPSPIGRVSTQKRKVRENHEQGSILVSGRSARVGGRRDVRHGLAVDQWNAILARHDGKAGDVPEDECRVEMEAPLLVVYLLRGVTKGHDGQSEQSFRSDDLVIPALALHFPGQKQIGKERVVYYRLNRVAQKELEFEQDDDEAEDDDLD